jgi:hypothetical protein
MAEARQAQQNRPLWICPDCGARLVSRNLWHSCGSFTFDDLFGGSDAQVQEAASRLIALCEEFGDVQVIPQKSRLALVARVRFSVLLPQRKSVIVGFALHRWITSPRVLRTDDFGPRWRYHYVRVAGATSIDDELISWLRESHDVVGMQAGLD